MTLGDKLRELREKKGLTTREVSKIFNVGKSTISNYETGYRRPDTEMLKKLADYYDVTTDYLLGRTDDPNLYIVEKEVMPDKLKEVGVEYLTMAKEMKDKKIDIEVVKNIIKAIEGQKNKQSK